MKGNITRRGKTSWRIKFDVGFDPITGKRKYHTETVRGARSNAVNLLAKRISEQAEGQLVERTALPLVTYARHWLSVIAPASTSAKTRERYAELIEQHIIPQLGAIEIQKLDGPRIDAFYNHLLTSGRRNGRGGLSAQTVRHIHRLLSQILSSAVKAQKLRHSPMVAVQTTPKVRKPHIQVLADEELGTLFQYLKERPLYMPVLLAASTGMRRGEILGLRWCDLDFDRSTLQIAQVVEALKKSVSIKEPKTERSRRTSPARNPRPGAKGSSQSASRTLPQTRVRSLRVGVPDLGWETNEPASLH